MEYNIVFDVLSGSRKHSQNKSGYVVVNTPLQVLYVVMHECIIPYSTCRGMLQQIQAPLQQTGCLKNHLVHAV